MGDGKVGIGKTPSAWYLDVDSPDGYIASFDGSSNTGIVINSSSGIGDIIGYSNSASSYNKVNIRGASGTGLVVDTSNNVGIGTALPQANTKISVSDSTSSSNKILAYFVGEGVANEADGGQYIAVQRGGAISQVNSASGGIVFGSNSATGSNSGIKGIYQFTSGRDIRFFTSADNTSDPTDKMVIKGNGNVGIGSNGNEVQGDGYLLSAYGTVVTCWFENRSTNSAHEVMILNRKESAGTMVAFAYNDSEKGTITQSGGTISYNAFMGSHYTESSEDVSSILLGTVMETVDALVENKYEDQKRLVKCKVSSTSESPNVYGVWIEDNQTGQIAALGSSWCRISSEVTVSMGDLLVSNGDGTAKVQTDDILRSKTIGKVTSTVKKETYSDGSYVVPVILYCG
jgi:hypothetical protein